MGIPWDGIGINCYGMGQTNMSHEQSCAYNRLKDRHDEILSGSDEDTKVLLKQILSKHGYCFHKFLLSPFSFSSGV